jgi:hypothetical protein
MIGQSVVLEMHRMVQAADRGGRKVVVWHL